MNNLIRTDLRNWLATAESRGIKLKEVKIVSQYSLEI